MKQTQNFTEGKIFAPLIRFALPVLLALFLQTMYGAVDLLVVGQFGTSADVSAVSTGSLVMQTVTVVITSLAMGLTVSAGVGVAEKLCGFIMLVPSAYMQAMSAFVAQNMGAGKPERARKALLCGIALSLAVGSVMGYFTFFHGNLLAGLFAKDAPVIAAAADYLKAYAIDCLLTAFLFCYIGYFNGTGATIFVMLQGIIGAFGVRLPVSWFVSRQSWATLFYIGLATPASTMVQIILCGVYFVYTLRKQRKMNLQ